MSTRCRLILVLVFLGASHSGFSQCGEWEKLFYYKNVSINDAAYDRFGNTYIVGNFSEGDFTLGPNTFSLPPGGSGVFIAKFDKRYSLVWAISPTAGKWAQAYRIEIAQDDNFIVAGNFATSISFGCSSFHGTENGNVFLVKLTADGVPLWLTGSAGGNRCQVDQITMSPNGNCVLTARFSEKNLLS
ncbi:MAG TPA: hypothetical protein VD884_21020, partial [Ohtaekwangia sp.]|nr:hypothetical protein [Ohtaekwangia sp.]